MNVKHYFTHTEDKNDEFSTITLAKKNNDNTNAKSKVDDIISSLFTMNHELWQVINIFYF